MEDKNQQLKTGKKFKIVLITFLILGSLYFLFIGLTQGKGFLIPLVTAITLAMVMNPVAEKLKSWGLGKGLAILISDLLIVAFLAFMIFLLISQVSKISNNWSQIEKRMKPKIEKVQTFMSNKLNVQVLSDQQQTNSPNQDQSSSESSQTSQDKNTGGSAGTTGSEQQKDNSQQKGSSFSLQSLNQSSIKSALAGFAKNFFSFLGDLLLILVYIFFFMFYKEKFETAIIGFVQKSREKQAGEILKKVSKTAQQYLFGRFILILILAALYMAGFSILGIKYALFVSITAALFSLVPYLGNLIGLLLAVAMSFMFGSGSIGKIIAIVGVFSVIQFIESYILEPYIVGHKVDVNPVVIIVGVVLGGIVWGVMGMILSIPILGILKVIFDNTQSLRPLGYALDERDISSGGKEEKVKEWVMKKAKKLGIGNQ